MKHYRFTADFSDAWNPAAGEPLPAGVTSKQAFDTTTGVLSHISNLHEGAEVAISDLAYNQLDGGGLFVAMVVFPRNNVVQQ